MSRAAADRHLAGFGAVHPSPGPQPDRPALLLATTAFSPLQHVSADSVAFGDPGACSCTDGSSIGPCVMPVSDPNSTTQPGAGLYGRQEHPPRPACDQPLSPVG